MYLTKQKQSPVYLIKCRIVSIFWQISYYRDKNNVVYKMQVRHSRTWREDRGQLPPKFPKFG